MPSASQWTFGPFRLDPRNACLWRGVDLVPLPPTAFALLHYLVTHAGVVSTFIMGLGTAITVAAIATLAVGAKSLAARFAQTRSGYGSLALRGLEVAAAAFVLAFGVLLLMGYMASERMFAV